MLGVRVLPPQPRTWPVRSAVRTPASHVGNRGSIPLRATKPRKGELRLPFFVLGRFQVSKGESKGGRRRSRAGKTRAKSERPHRCTASRETRPGNATDARNAAPRPARREAAATVAFDSPTGYQTQKRGATAPLFICHLIDETMTRPAENDDPAFLDIH